MIRFYNNIIFILTIITLIIYYHKTMTQYYKSNIRNITARIIPFLILIFTITSCNYYQERKVAEITVLSPPKSKKVEKVAVLPFNNQTEFINLGHVVRTALTANLSPKGYSVARAGEIDHFLEMAEINRDNIDLINISQLGKIVKADAIFYGTVTHASKIFAGIYSVVAVGASIKMVDTVNGNTIWAAEHIEKTHGGGPFAISPFSIPNEVFDSAINVRKKVIEETAQRLVKKFMDGIPDNQHRNTFESTTISIKNIEGESVVKYIVHPNDTLYKIATGFYGNGSKWKYIKEANKDLKENNLHSGQELVIPDMPILNNLDNVKNLREQGVKRAVYKVKWGDSLYKIADAIYSEGLKWNIIYDNNKTTITSITDVPVGQVIILPLES